MSRRIYDLPSAAEYLAVGERMMRRLVAERRLPFHRVGRHLRFDERDLDAFLDANRVETATSRVAAARHLRSVSQRGGGP
jgi:excisionase family DNA binding protein